MNIRNFLPFAFLFLFVHVYAQNDAYHNTLETQLQTDYSLTGGSWVLTPNEITNINNGTSYGCTRTQSTITGQDFTQAVNLDIPNTGANPWNSAYNNMNINAIQQGDRLLAVVWLRTVSAPNNAAKLSIYTEDGTTYAKEFYLTVNTSTDWQQYFIPFESSDSYPVGDLNLGFHLAYQQQQLEFGGLTFINYGTSVPLENLPSQLNLGNYPGSDPNSPWRAEAANRIEQHRKADMEIQVVDASGNALPSATVHVEMLRHEYAFGSAVNPRKLANNSNFNPTYQDKILDLDGNGNGFNWVVTENALKWRAWEQEWAGTPAETANGIQWLHDHNIKVRGHVLVWPRWSSMPTDMEANSSNPTYMKNRINGHLNTILNYPGIRDIVTEWDVVNEIAHERELEYALQGTAGYPTGREIYSEIMNQTLLEDPSISCYVNDYNVLNVGRVTGSDYVLFKSMLQEIIDAGTTLDGIGLQSHMNSALTPPDSLYAILEDCYQTFGKEIKITEYDQNEIIPQDIQAQYLGDFLTMIFSHPATNGFLTWGFWDGAHYDNSAPLFNLDWTPKPAHATFTDLLFNQWWTNETLISDSNGVVDLRGFKGDYRITVTHNGKTVTQDISLSGNVNTIVEIRDFIYVDHTATGINDGSSWENAFTNLQNALAIGQDATIYIAEGIYIPSSTASRTASFSLSNNTRLLGAYPNGGGEQDASIYTTILSGEVDNLAGFDGNSYHVVKLQNISNTILDGITISGGSADNAASFGRARGAGIYSIGSSLTLNNVKVIDNNAIYGGGIFATLSPNVRINHSEFSNNIADYGSAIYHSNETMLYINSSSVINNNSTVRCAIEINNSLYTRIENSVIANNSSTNANAIAFIATNRNQSCDIYNSTILGETKNKNLMTFQIGFGDQLDLNLYNTIVAHQNMAFDKNVKAFNNNILNFNHYNCYFQGSNVIGNGINNLFSATDGDLLLNADYSVDACSPVVNNGNDNHINITTDIDGNNRFYGSVDIGAYESQMNCIPLFKEISEINNISDIKIFPNPTNGKLTVQTEEENIDIYLFDILGNRLVSTSGRVIDLSGFAKGIYILVVERDGDILKMERVIRS